jgi:RES domain-containing protein
MIVYRFAHRRFVTDLSGTGARLKGGRWNSIGVPVLYVSTTISLSLLETLVNTKSFDELENLQLAEIEVPEIAIHRITNTKLKNNWIADTDYTNFIGNEILNANKHLIVQCPSAIVISENNFLINPTHPEFKKVKIKEVKDFYFDDRLFKHD